MMVMVLQLYFSKIALNHELQIKVIELLISEGPWSKQREQVDGPVEPKPPPGKQICIDLSSPNDHDCLCYRIEF